MVNYIALVTALALESVAAYYSIIGLTTIFVSAFIPIAIMGSVLEVAKVVAVSWVYRNWNTAPVLIKYYLVAAITVLMLITSMGTFGYLSKAHMDQAVPTGAIQDKLNILDEKIKFVKDNIDASRKELKQLDEAVDQTMARTTDASGANQATAIRRSQQKDRNRILQEIQQSQSTLASLSEQRAPISGELKKVEAEVGPIKYIAALAYGSAPSEDMLDRAVTWVIILLVSVFDPLAVVLLLAANQGLSKKEITEDFFRDDSVKKKSWIDMAADLIQRRKSGILEIDQNSIVNMK